MVIPGFVGVQGLPISPAPDFLLPQHRQPQHLAGLPQEVQGIVVPYVADIHPVDLGQGDLRIYSERAVRPAGHKPAQKAQPTGSLGPFLKDHSALSPSSLSKYPHLLTGLVTRFP